MLTDDFKTIMESVCEICHWPYVDEQDELDARCENCPVEAVLSNFFNK